MAQWDMGPVLPPPHSRAGVWDFGYPNPRTDSKAPVLRRAVDQFTTVTKYASFLTPAEQMWMSTIVTQWVVGLTSTNPFVIVAALSNLTQNAGPIFKVDDKNGNRPLLHATLILAEDPAQYLFVRRAAIRAAALLSPNDAAQRLSRILLNRREQPELRVAVAEGYRGEVVPTDIFNALLLVTTNPKISQDHPEVVSASLRTWPYANPNFHDFERLIHLAFKTDNTDVYDAAVDAIKLTIRIYRTADMSVAVDRMLNRVRGAIETTRAQQGLYVAERLGTVARPMLESIVADSRSIPEVRDAVRTTLSRLQSATTLPGDPLAFQNTPPSVVSLVSSSMRDRICTASPEQLLAMLDGEVPAAERDLINHHLRAFGPAGFDAIQRKYAKAAPEIQTRLRKFIETMGADAVMAMPHLAPHGMNGRFDSPETRGWRKLGGGGEGILQYFKK